MRILHEKTALSSIWSLLLVVVLAGCGSDSSNGQTVGVNLSLVVDGPQAEHRAPISRWFAWIEHWLPGATSAWAQSVTQITSIQVDISGPGISVPATTTVPVSNPTSGEEIPISLQAPVGTNRTITVAARNAEGNKIFGGTLPNVTLAPGPPVALVITLKPVFTITIKKAGTGTGTVTSSQAGISCDPSCSIQSAEFDSDIAIALNAAASPGSIFAGWSGDCTGTGACIFEAGSRTGAATVTATFTAVVNSSSLSLIKAGSGTGTVTSQPSGIFCGTACTADFATGSVVTLTAFPTAGSTFTGWQGGGCGGPNRTCLVLMNGNQTVTATFGGSSGPTLTVTKLGAGSGTISSAPPGIAGCAATCSAGFAPGTVVTLTAAPTGGSTFVGWGGACAGTGSCIVDMSADQSVTAAFAPPVSQSLLTIEKIGSGAGRVTSSPIGVDCGSTCAASFATASTVTLTADANPNSTFIGWSGSGCTGLANCVVVMSGDQTVFARFDRSR